MTGEPLRSVVLCSRSAGLRSTVPVREDVDAPGLLLSRIDLPIRILSVLLLLVVPLRTPPSLEPETDGVLPPIEVPIREVLPELAAGCLAPVGVEGLRVPIELPIRDLDVPRPDIERLLEPATGCLAAFEPDGLSILIELVVPDREPSAGLSILIELDVLGRESEEGLSILIELLALGRKPGAGLSILIELPMRDVLLELTLELKLTVGRLGDPETDGVLVLIEPPMLDLVLVIGPRVDEETDGPRVVIELPIRALLLGLSRTLELLLIEVEPVELLPTEMPDEGPR